MTTAPVAPPRGHALEDLFGRRHGVMLGVVHLLPLPGSPGYAGEPMGAIYDRALADGRAYAEAGFDGLIVENHGDVPFLKPELLGPETAAVMAVAAECVRRELGLPMGINVLANAASHAVAIAAPRGRPSCA